MIVRHRTQNFPLDGAGIAVTAPGGSGTRYDTGIPTGAKAGGGAAPGGGGGGGATAGTGRGGGAASA